ncbi:MATE family efflux transporter [candidate division KSB1 bacterium]|nr:MATE family efflux transporter [candidate division KSB1 bacterium]
MQTASLNKRFFRLAIPNILANISVPLVGLVDTAMLGHLSEIRFLAGVALASVLFDYIFWTFGFLRMGTTGLTAQASGKQDKKEVMAIAYRGFAIALVTGVFLLIVKEIIAHTGFAILTAEPDVESAGKAYFDARIPGAPAVLCNYVFTGWFLGRERSDLVLYLTLFTNILNVIFNYYFLFVLHMAAAGIGWATSLSNYLTFFLATAFFLQNKLDAETNWRSIFAKEKMLALFRLNVDILIRTLFLISAFAVFTNFSAVLGVALLAANSIILRILSFAAYLIDGLAFATESLAGIFTGKKDYQSLKQVLKIALLWGELFAFNFIAIMVFIPDYFYPLLTSHNEIIQLLKAYDFWVYIALVFSALAYIYDGFFLGITQVKTLRNAMIWCFLLFFLPLAILAVERQNNDLLWLAMVAFMVGRAGTLGWAAWRIRIKG